MDTPDQTPKCSPPSRSGTDTSPVASLSGPSALTARTREEASLSTRLRTGWPRFQRSFPPRSGRIWLIGGAPGSHKTQVALNLAADMALARHRVLFVTLELTMGEIGSRLLSRFSGVPMDRLDRAFGRDHDDLTDQENERVAVAEEKIAGLTMYLRFHGAEEHGSKLGDVLRSATRARFDAVYVDHLGMIDRGVMDEMAAIPRAADHLRQLARGVYLKGYSPFVCVTTPLSRKRDEDDHPKLGHLRGSGNLEYDADGVLVLQKRERKGEAEGPDEVDGYVLKQRQGRSPLVLAFEADGAVASVYEKLPPTAVPPQHWQEDE